MRWNLLGDYLVIFSGSADDLADQVDCVMGELVKLTSCNNDVDDPAVSLDLSTGHVEIELVVDCDSRSGALAKADEVIRTAIHAAGGCTAGWADERRTSIEYEPGSVRLQPA